MMCVFVSILSMYSNHACKRQLYPLSYHADCKYTVFTGIFHLINKIIKLYFIASFIQLEKLHKTT